MLRRLALAVLVLAAVGVLGAAFVARPYVEIAWYRRVVNAGVHDRREFHEAVQGLVRHKAKSAAPDLARALEALAVDPGELRGTVREGDVWSALLDLDPDRAVGALDRLLLDARPAFDLARLVERAAPLFAADRLPTTTRARYHAAWLASVSVQFRPGTVTGTMNGRALVPCSVTLDGWRIDGRANPITILGPRAAPVVDGVEGASTPLIESPAPGAGRRTFEFPCEDPSACPSRLAQDAGARTVGVALSLGLLDARAMPLTTLRVAPPPYPIRARARR